MASYFEKLILLLDKAVYLIAAFGALLVLAKDTVEEVIDLVTVNVQGLLDSSLGTSSPDFYSVFTSNELEMMNALIPLKRSLGINSSLLHLLELHYFNPLDKVFYTWVQQLACVPSGKLLKEMENTVKPLTSVSGLFLKP